MANSNKGFMKRSGSASMKAECIEAKALNKSRRMERARKFKLKLKAFMNEKCFVAQLWRGDSKYPITEEMSANQMGVKNRKLVLEFSSKIGKGEKATLWAWKFADGRAFVKARDVYLGEKDANINNT